MSTPPQLVVKYRVRDEVDVGGLHMPVVLHGRAGSSALVSIANAVIRSCHLGSALNTEGGIRGRPKYVRTEALQEVIEMALVDRLQDALNAKLINEVFMLSLWSEYKEMIRLLPKCSSVDPIFTSCDTFAEKGVVEILSGCLGYFLYHGLLVDPEEDPDTAQAIGSKSYNEIAKMLPSEVEDNAVLKKFLESTKDGLTASGLRYLKESIKESKICVLFRNNHFSFVAKVGEDLLVLQSAEEQVKKTPDAVWRVLEEVSEKGKLLASDFSEIEQQAIGHDAEESIALKRQEAILEEEAREKLKKSKPSSRQRRRLKNKMAESVVACDKSSEEFYERVKIERDQEVEREETQEEKDDNTSETFKRFLTEFTEEGTSAPFFEGQVKAMHHCKSYKLTVKFKDLENHDKETARYVCNNMPRIHDRLNYCACTFLLEHDEFKTKPDEVFEKTRIEISDLPVPNSVQAFSTFALEHAMHRVWELYDYGGKKVSATTYLGRKAALGYLNFILKKYKAGLCWDGSFTLEDFFVLDQKGGFEFVIMKEASEGYCKEKAIADFNRFCVILFRYFKDDEADEKYPAYFDQFQVDYLFHMPNREDTEAYARWEKYMAHHFAFKAPQARSTLVTETYEVCDSMRNGPDYDLLNDEGDLEPWSNDVTSSGSISLISTYEYGSVDPNTNRYVVLSYWKLLIFGRHFSRHMLRAKRDQGVVIPVQDLLIVDLMLGHVLKGQLAKVIRHIMMANNFSGGLFSSAWRHFEASETFDEDPKVGRLDMSEGDANTSSSQVVS